MNKIFQYLCLSAGLLTTFNAWSQYTNGGETTTTEKKIKIGAYVAPTLSWMRPTTTKSDDGLYRPENAGSRFGFMYGIMADYNFSENYAFATGIQVNMTGGKINSQRIDGDIYAPNIVKQANFDYHLNYIEIPAAIKLRTNEFSGFRFFGQAGLTLGFNIAKKADYYVIANDDGGLSQEYTGEKEKIKGTLAIAPALLQMNIGLGTEYALTSKLRAYIGVFFNNGFLPDATNPKKYKMAYDLPFSDANTRLNNLALRIGMFF